MNARPTAASNAAAIADLAATVQALTVTVQALVDTKAPAKAAPRKTTRKPAAKTAQAKSDRLAGGKGPAVAAKPTKALCKATRAAFVAAAAKDPKISNLVDFAGLSTKTIAAMCLEDASLVPAGFRIGEGYAALLG